MKYWVFLGNIGCLGIVVMILPKYNDGNLYMTGFPIINVERFLFKDWFSALPAQEQPFSSGSQLMIVTVRRTAQTVSD